MCVKDKKRKIHHMLGGAAPYPCRFENRSRRNRRNSLRGNSSSTLRALKPKDGEDEKRVLESTACVSGGGELRTGGEEGQQCRRAAALDEDGGGARSAARGWRRRGAGVARARWSCARAAAVRRRRGGACGAAAASGRVAAERGRGRRLARKKGGERETDSRGPRNG